MTNKSAVIPIQETDIYTWFERDRAHVELRNRLNDETIIEWWDEEVGGAIEDGFLSPRDYHTSAYEYALYLGVLPGGAL